MSDSKETLTKEIIYERFSPDMYDICFIAAMFLIIVAFSILLKSINFVLYLIILCFFIKKQIKSNIADKSIRNSIRNEQFIIQQAGVYDKSKIMRSGTDEPLGYEVLLWNGNSFSTYSIDEKLYKRINKDDSVYLFITPNYQFFYYAKEYVLCDELNKLYTPFENPDEMKLLRSEIKQFDKEERQAKNEYYQNTGSRLKTQAKIIVVFMLICIILLSVVSKYIN